MDALLRALIIEKSRSDIALEVRALEAAGYRVTYTVAVTAAEMKAALAEQTFDIIITDHDLPQFEASKALDVLKQSGLDIPFLIISANMDEKKAVALLKAGAHDYITKDRLSNLTSNVKNALQNAENRRLIKQAEKALQMSEEKYRMLFANANESIFVAQAGKIVFLNPRMLKLTGYSAEEITGWPFTELIHPDDSEMVIKRHISRLKGEIVPYSYDFRVVQKNGTVVWVKLSAVLMTWEGKPATLNFLEDITAHKLSDDALRESEEQLRDSLENAPDGIYMSDLEGNFLYGNRRCEEIVGYMREELIGKNFLELNLLPENSLGKAAELLQACSEGRKSRIEEFELIRKDGGLIPVEINTSMVRIKGQAAVLAFVRDITERKQAGDVLRFTRILLDNATDRMACVDREAHFVDVNETFCRFTGYSREELLSMRVGDIDSGFSAELWPEFWKNLKQSGSLVFESSHHSREGRISPVEISATYFEHKGKEYHSAFARDITERKLAEGKIKESEEKYRSIVENSSDQIFMMDKDYKLLALNAAAAGLFQKAPQEIVGKSLFDVFPPKEAEHFSKQIKAAFEAGKSLTIEDKLALQGGERYYNFTLNPIKDDKGKVMAVTGIVRDITDLRQAEETKAARMIAEAANLAKTDFLSNMSHELRTPLSSIIGFSEVLFDQTFGPLNETQKDYLNDVMTSGRHLLSLINDILDLSKVEAGKMQLTLSTFSLNRLLEDSFVMIKEKAFKHNIDLASEIADEVGEVQADERKIKQIVYNLLSNAVKFTPDGGKAGIRARKDAEQIEVSVWDTGIGLSAEDRNKLFEKFTQIGNIYTGKTEGTGLGLSLVKSMVELHGGKVWVASGGMDKGSTFTFTLPISQKVNGEVRTDRG